MMSNIDKQSDSKFYHGDCVCIKTKCPSNIAIQCYTCINCPAEVKQMERVGYICDCTTLTITHKICIVCSELRDKIDKLNDELDNLTYNLVIEIKMFADCNDKLERINAISIELRNLNRMLLENLIPKKRIN
mgnify:FL=1